MTIPRAPGLAMPAEWAAHSRCWMAWPCRTELWGERMPAARKICAEIAKAIVAYEPVTMIARPDLAADASLHCGQGISVLPLEHDDFLDARCRAHLRDRPGRRFGRRRLALQRLRRAHPGI